jgi:hypothetical protein
MHMAEEAQGLAYRIYALPSLSIHGCMPSTTSLADNSQQPSSDKPSQTVGRPLILLCHVKNACRARSSPFIGS